MGNSDDRMDSGRRAALARLGLGVAVVYAAPVVTRIDTAKAAFPSCSDGPGVGLGRGGGNGRGGGGGCGGGTANNPDKNPNPKAFK